LGKLLCDKRRINKGSHWLPFSTSKHMTTENTTQLEQTHSHALADAGMYVFMGDVDQENIKPIVEWILHENHVVKKKRKELLLMVCSEGGDMGAAFALIDVMHSSLIPVKTVGLGVIASAGLLIFIAGCKGRRVLTPNTSILSHQFSWSSEGKVHELFATMREFELTQARMVSHYEACTGLDADQIRKHLLPPHDIWLSAEEAKALGICDHVSAVTKT
jgi:ATP-dependent Clp protease protease subunit